VSSDTVDNNNTGCIPWVWSDLELAGGPNTAPAYGD